MPLPVHNDLPYPPDGLRDAALQPQAPYPLWLTLTIFLGVFAALLAWHEFLHAGGRLGVAVILGLAGWLLAGKASEAAQVSRPTVRRTFPPSDTADFLLV